MPPEPSPLLAHRGIVLVEPALLPALVPDAYGAAGEVGGVRLVQAGGRVPGTRPFYIAPTEALGPAARALAAAGAGALLFVGTFTSPARAVEPGDVLVVERARTPELAAVAHPAMVNKLHRRCELRGLTARRGSVAAAGSPPGEGDAGLNDNAAAFLHAATEARVPATAVLVCEGPETTVSQAPAAVLESFDRLFGVIQEILGTSRPPAP